MNRRIPESRCRKNTREHVRVLKEKIWNVLTTFWKQVADENPDKNEVVPDCINR